VVDEGHNDEVDDHHKKKVFNRVTEEGTWLIELKLHLKYELNLRGDWYLFQVEG
jgi:hypothetical protein